MWISDDIGNHLKTLKIYANHPYFMNCLIDWSNVSGEFSQGTGVDGYSGATRLDVSSSNYTASWDMVDKNGVTNSAGTYQFHFEFTEDNADANGTNRHTFGSIAINGTSNSIVTNGPNVSMLKATYLP